MTLPHKPRGVLKWAYTLPRYLYRWHAGWLLGHRFLSTSAIIVNRVSGIEMTLADPLCSLREDARHEGTAFCRWDEE